MIQYKARALARQKQRHPEKTQDHITRQNELIHLTRHWLSRKTHIEKKEKWTSTFSLLKTLEKDTDTLINQQKEKIQKKKTTVSTELACFKNPKRQKAQKKSYPRRWAVATACAATALTIPIIGHHHTPLFTAMIRVLSTPLMGLCGLKFFISRKQLKQKKQRPVDIELAQKRYQLT